MCSIEDVGTGTGRAGTAGGDKHSNRHRRGENITDDVTYGGIQSTRGIHAQNDDIGPFILCLLHASVDIIANCRADGTFDVKQGGIRCHGLVGTEHAIQTTDKHNADSQHDAPADGRPSGLYPL